MKIISVISYSFVSVSEGDIGLAFLYVCMKMQTHWMYIFCNVGSYVRMTKTNPLGN